MNDFPRQTRAENSPDRYSRSLVEWKNPQSSLRAPSPLCRGNDLSRVVFSVRATTAGVKTGAAQPEFKTEEVPDGTSHSNYHSSHDSHQPPPPLTLRVNR